MEPQERDIGYVVSITGSQAVVWLATTQGGPALAGPGRITIGTVIAIRSGEAYVVGMVVRMSIPMPEAGDESGQYMLAEVDLVGEVYEDRSGERFQRGVSHYPTIGDKATLISSRHLGIIHKIEAAGTIDVGFLQQDSSVQALVNVDELLDKHFAVLGTTGVGKSTAVALILQQILAARDDLRIFLIDPHNEYADCFGPRAHVVSPRNLKLPFWLFNFEEIVDIFFRGRPGVEEEVEILSEVIPQARGRFAVAKARGGDRLLVRRAESSGHTVDTPVPYRVSDLISLIDDRMGKLENRSSWTKYSRLITRIETVAHDPRYAFMFDNINIEDTMVEVLGDLFRLPINGKPITIMQLAGLPAEVVDSVVSVLGRMAFDFGLWSDGAVPLLVVCEEAHRYAPADRSIGFGPTRRALSRIAKEGRKYGIYLGVVTQRPAELDATILSQCSTVFAMRMANDRDQGIVRSAVSDAASSLLSFLPSLGTREVIAFGEGVALPTRLRFREVEQQYLPRSQSVRLARFSSGGVDKDFMEAVVERWRGATSNARSVRGGDNRLDSDLAMLEEGLGARSPLRAPVRPASPDQPAKPPPRDFTRRA